MISSAVTPPLCEAEDVVPLFCLTEGRSGGGSIYIDGTTSRKILIK